MPRLRPVQERQEAPPQKVREIIPGPDEELVEGQQGVRFEARESEPEPGPQPQPAPKPKPDAQAKPPEDEASTALQKQIEALKNSEAELKRRNEEIGRQHQEALRQAQQYQQDVFKQQREVLESQELAIGNALAAARSAAEKAESDIASAIEAGDAKAQTEAYRRLARAESDIGKFEGAKEEFDNQKRMLQEAAKQQQQQPQQQQPQYPQIAIDWMKDHPDWQHGWRFQKLQSAFNQAVEEGYQPYSKPQIKRMEEIIGIAVEEPAPEPDEQAAQQAQSHQEKKQAAMVSAPPSRQAPGSGQETNPSRIKLTPAQKEAAAMSGITEVEYARRLIELGQHKANGMYGESR